MASSGRRSSRPHLPPEQYCTISSASPPTANPKVSISAHASRRAENDPSPRPSWAWPRNARITAMTEKIAPDHQRAVLPAVDKGGRAELRGELPGVRRCVRFVSHSWSSSLLGRGGRFGYRNRNRRICRDKPEPCPAFPRWRSASMPGPPSMAAAMAARTRDDLPPRPDPSGSGPAHRPEHPLRAPPGSAAAREYMPPPPSDPPASVAPSSRAWRRSRASSRRSSAKAAATCAPGRADWRPA